MTELLDEFAKEKTGLPEDAHGAETTQSAPVRSEKKAKLIFILILLVLIAGIVISVVLLTNVLSKRKDFFPTLEWNTQKTDTRPDVLEDFSLPVYPITELKTAQAGDDVLFGFYEQDDNDENGKEKIEWLVLEREGDRMLLLSRFGLDCIPYNEVFEEVTWKDCSLRKWLNGTFLKEAFTETECGAIERIEITADSSGFVSRDKVFLLSISEQREYFPFQTEGICALTPYAFVHGASCEDFATANGSGKACELWLRSSGYVDNSAAYVTFTGFSVEIGRYVNSECTAVRPAIWVDLSILG